MEKRNAGYRRLKNCSKSDEPYLALLAYRSIPVANGYSPAELLMNRRLRTIVYVYQKRPGYPWYPIRRFCLRERRN